MSYYKHLQFFDKQGGSLNFLYDETTDTWSGTVYIPTVSAGLYENAHLFIIENVLNDSLEEDYAFPLLGQPTSPTAESWRTRWQTDDSEDQIFTYVIEEENDVPFIKKYEELLYANAAVSYTLSSPSEQKIASSINSTALKINIAFTSNEEDIYERSLIIEDMSFDVPKTVAIVNFYGETVAEDERLKLMLENFGRSFNQKDALIVKDYDVKEPLPDWQKVNEKRKELLLAGEDIYPYVGAYKGLINVVKFFGYQSLRIKEYWLNIDVNSENYNKIQQYQLTGLFNDEYSPLLKHPLIPSTVYKKTSMFGLFYDINVATGDLDEFGIPTVENDSTFTNEEVLVKLFALKDRLKKEFLPLNARIVDIVGEGIYFVKYGTRSWTDELRTIQTNVGDVVNFTPNIEVGYVRDIRRFQVKRFSPGLDLPFNRFTNEVNPYTSGQQYPPHSINGLIESIEDYYEELRKFPFPYQGNKQEFFGDEPGIVAGCPVVFSGQANAFTWDDMTMSWDDTSYQAQGSPPVYSGPYTWDTIDFSNFYEIEWTIEKQAPLPYNFQMRGSVYDYYRLPHFLPYAGKYKVTMKLYDMFNNASLQIKEDVIEVFNRELEITAFCRFRDFDDYSWDGTTNTWDDLGGSSWHFPIEGISPYSSPINEKLLAWPRYHNQEDMLIYDTEQEEYEDLIHSTAKNTERVSTRNLMWMNMDLSWDEMYHSTWDMYDYHAEFLGGFRIFDPGYGDAIQIDDYDLFYFTEPSPADDVLSLQEAVDQLNASTNPGISKFTYQVRFQPNASPTLAFIHACAKFPGADGWHYITYYQGTSPGSIYGDPYSFRKPTWLQGGIINVDQQIAQINNSQNPPISIDEDLMFLDIPIEDRIHDITSPMLSPDIPGYDYWKEKGYVATEEPTTQYPYGQRRGQLPSWAGSGAFTNNDLRVFVDSFNVPLGVPIIFINGNSEIPGKMNTRWIVTNEITGEHVIEVANKPFLIINLIEESTYTIESYVTDSNGNTAYKKRQGFFKVSSRENMVKPQTLATL